MAAAASTKTQMGTVSRWMNTTGPRVTALLEQIEKDHGGDLWWSGLALAAPAHCMVCSWGVIPQDRLRGRGRWSIGHEAEVCSGGHEQALCRRRALELWVSERGGGGAGRPQGQHDFVMAPLGAGGLVTGAYCRGCPLLLLEVPPRRTLGFPRAVEQDCCPGSGGELPLEWSYAHNDFQRNGFYQESVRQAMMQCSRDSEGAPGASG